MGSGHADLVDIGHVVFNGHTEFSGHVVFNGQWSGHNSAGSMGNGHVVFNGQGSCNDEWTVVI